MKATKKTIKNPTIKKAGSRSYSEILKIVKKIQSKLEELPGKTETPLYPV